MPETRIGTCGNCGGDVVGWTGPYYSIIPPPPPRCTRCHAVPAYADDTIPMGKPGVPRDTRISDTSTNYLPD